MFKTIDFRDSVDTECDLLNGLDIPSPDHLLSLKHFPSFKNLSIAQKNHTECLSGFEQRTPCFDGPSICQLFVDDFAQFLVGSTKLTENIEISMKSTPSPLQTKDIHTDFSN